MGHWGNGMLQNDSAADFEMDLEEAEDKLQLIVDTLRNPEIGEVMQGKYTMFGYSGFDRFRAAAYYLMELFPLQEDLIRETLSRYGVFIAYSKSLDNEERDMEEHVKDDVKYLVCGIKPENKGLFETIFEGKN